MYLLIVFLFANTARIKLRCDMFILEVGNNKQKHNDLQELSNIYSIFL